MAARTTATASSQLLLVAVATSLAAAAAIWTVAHRRRRRREEAGAPKVEEERSRSASAGSDVDNDVAAVPIPEVDVSGKSGGGGSSSRERRSPLPRRILTKGTVTVVHGSVTGTCRRYAEKLHRQISAASSLSLNNNSKSSESAVVVQLASVEDFDWWDELINDDGDENDDSNNYNNDAQGDGAKRQQRQKSPPPMLILLLPTYTNGSWPPNAEESLNAALEEVLTDWRVEKHPLKGKLRLAAFGMGSSEYGFETVGRPVKEAVRKFQRLGAKCVVKVRVGDDAVADHADGAFEEFQRDVLRQAVTAAALKQANVKAGVVNGKSSSSNNKKKTSSSSCACAEGNSNSSLPSKENGCCQQEQNGCKENDQKAACEVEEGASDYDSEEEVEREPEILDLEDLGDSIMASQITDASGGEPREMVTPSQAAALKKEGYRLIGTHSAVKLCRWTKHQLRGRGGCYKHTFYGITSYQCMEATPSLACANKCVFCWRHHKNPVGKEWKWKTDDPFVIVDEAVKEHVRMIKETRGIPGVQMDRWKEAHTVRHCALSLVGEPIMYPRIDELLQELHARRISTFLVTNGQHPQAIEKIRPITQLYVSVDAPTQESLIAIDRPLFNDAWDRLKQSLASLKDKGQRTVARLTVVKGWNSDEIEGYAKLIALGRVSLVEVKGVTFCGKSDASNLNMTNTPFHHEVVDLTRTLKLEIDKMRAAQQQQQGGERGGDINGVILPEYDLACEHRHSCSVLLARVDQFAVDDPVTGQRRWKTWIDYDKFHQLAARHAEDPTFSFSVTDYIADTPSWALFGSDEEGFDPTDRRHRKKTKHPKYTQFDENGIPTHDHNGDELRNDERERLQKMMEEKLREVGSGSTVTELKGGAKEVLDASLMFRGLVVAK